MDCNGKFLVRTYTDSDNTDGNIQIDKNIIGERVLMIIHQGII